MSWATAVDASDDLLQPEEAQCLTTNGIPLYIQCLWTAIRRPTNWLTSLQNAMAADMEIAAYVSINSSSHTGGWHVDQGLAGMPQAVGERLQFIAIDVELQGIRASTIRQAINRVRELGYRPAIYTSSNVWRNYVIFDIPDDFNDVLLYNAYWDGSGDVDFGQFRYGQWQPHQVLIEQWSGGTVVCGQNVDRNTVNIALLLEQPDDEEELMQDPRLDELIRTYSGDPKIFDIRSGTGWRQGPLTYLQWQQYRALGWLRTEDHTHELTGQTGAPV